MKTVYYFTADWCGPCKKMRPIVEDLNREQTIAKFQMIDADDNTDLVLKFEIRSIPTFILLDNDGNEASRIVGSHTRKELEDFING